MKIKITKSKVHGAVTAPPSKSVSHRAIIAAALSYGTSKLTNVLVADDTKRTINALRQFGVTITKKNATLIVRGSGGKLQRSGDAIELGNSGSSMRFLTAVAGLVRGVTVFTGEQRLCERPMRDLFGPLKKMGVTARPLQRGGCLPLRVLGGTIRGGEIPINGNISSQFISALLLIAPFAKNTTTILTRDVRSKPYIELTVKIMNDFGVAVANNGCHSFIIPPSQKYIARTYEIEGDYSSSSYFFALAAITQSAVTVKNLNPDSKQGDKFLLTLLQRMGCEINGKEDEITISGTKKLSAITADLGDYPDIVQSLAVVAAFAKGTTKITNIGHLKHKETDRIEATAHELKKMGVRVAHNDHSLEITGGRPHGAVINTYNDHRMAMSFAVAGLGATKTTVINDAEVVRKSYPDFFKDLRSLGAQVKEVV